MWVDRGLLALMAVGALVMLMALTMSYAVALRLATYLALAFTGLIFAAGILAWLRGMRVARYFIIAWTAFLLGGIVNTLMVLGYLPNMFSPCMPARSVRRWRWACCRWHWPTGSTR